MKREVLQSGSIQHRGWRRLACDGGFHIGSSVESCFIKKKSLYSKKSSQSIRSLCSLLSNRNYVFFFLLLFQDNSIQWKCSKRNTVIDFEKDELTVGEGGGVKAGGKVHFTSQRVKIILHSISKMPKVPHPTMFPGGHRSLHLCAEMPQSGDLQRVALLWLFCFFKVEMTRISSTSPLISLLSICNH